MRFTQIKLIVIALFVLGISEIQVEAADWMSVGELKRYEKELRKQKKKFRSITCINEFRGSKRKPRILLKVGVRSNRSNRPWGWAVGRSVLNSGIKFEKAGMRRLTLHTSMEPNGYKFQCAVWG